MRLCISSVRVQCCQEMFLYDEGITVSVSFKMAAVTSLAYLSKLCLFVTVLTSFGRSATKVWLKIVQSVLV